MPSFVFVFSTPLVLYTLYRVWGAGFSISLLFALAPFVASVINGVYHGWGGGSTFVFFWGIILSAVFVGIVTSTDSGMTPSVAQARDHRNRPSGDSNFGKP